jgi:hypothetical protein
MWPAPGKSFTSLTTELLLFFDRERSAKLILQTCPVCSNAAYLTIPLS